MNTAFNSHCGAMKRGQRYDICLMANKPLCEGYIDEVIRIDGDITYVINFWDENNKMHVTTRKA